MFWELVGSIMAGVIGLVVYLYYMKKGQFEDLEDVKYQMFRNEEDK